MSAADAAASAETRAEPRAAPRAETRAAARAGFLRDAGLGDAPCVPLAGDASPRRYFRVAAHDPARRAVLMDADPASGEDVRPFAALTGWLRAQGFSAPEIRAADPAQGFLLLEDLGDALYARVCPRTPNLEPALYAAAADALVALRALTPPDTVAGVAGAHPVPPYDAATLLREARLATDWWTAAAAAPLPPDALAEFDALVGRACARVAADRRALTLRDYHAENLVWLPERAGLARVGLLDYQDALIGAPAYDLISLLEDARRDTSTALRAVISLRYAAALKASDPRFDVDAHLADAAALAAQRNLKIVGIFARLALRDRKPAYLALIPRVWAHLQRDLAHPELQALAGFVDRRIPAPTPERLARLRARAAAA